MRLTPLEANGNRRKAEAMQRRLFPVTFILVLSLLGAPSVAPASASTDGATTIIFTPTTPDAKAFVFDIRMNEANKCMRYRYSATMDLGEPLPWIATSATSKGILLVDGKEIPYPYTSYGGSFNYLPNEGDEHVMINVSAGDLAVYRAYEQTGYDHDSRSIGFTFEDGVCDISCRSAGFAEGAPACGVVPTIETVGFRLGIVMTPRVRDVSIQFEFYENGAFNRTSNRYEGTHGDARGWITFASESNRTFLKQMKDFDGTASYNGDPLGLDLPTSGGANLQTTVTTQRGMIGGFADGGFLTATNLLSYVGPGGEAGVVSDGPHFLSPPRLMTTFEGGPGKWTFNAHAYANPDYATLFLWGADIDTGTTNAPPQVSSR